MFNSTARVLRHYMALLLLLGLVLIPALSAHAATLTFTFTLPSNCTTSAGAFDSSGNLIRTLWRRVPYVAGPHTEVWNGLKDDGSAAAAGTYQIRVLYHDVQYVWDGAIGNTSANVDGESAWYTNNPPQGLAIDGTNGIVATGYAEGQIGVRRFVTSNPQVSLEGVPPATDTVWFHVATDGTRYYVADVGNGWDSSNSTFVAAYNVSDNSAATFSTGGQNLTMISPWNTNYPSVIDVSQKITSPTAFDQTFCTLNAATGIAVQKSGSVLAVAHGPLNVVRLFDKTTGASLGSITVTAPKGLAFTNAGDLVVCTGSSLKRYTSVGSSNTLATTINTSQPAIAVAAHPTTGNDVIIAAVGGTSQQIKAYTSTGTALWTFGTAGGYDGTNPDVSTSKFRFGEFTPLAMQSDGSFWVYDAATYRLLHVSSARAYLEQIAWTQFNYVNAVDPNTPTRVFGKGWLEYSVDYTKPLLPGDPQATGGNKSWKLVKDWSAGAPSKFLADSGGNTGFAGLHTVVTLTNPANSADKRTYGLVANYSTGKNSLVELPASGKLRDTGIELESSYLPSKSYSLYGNGDLRYSTLTNDVNGNPIQTIYKQALSSFDGSGNPVWGSPVVLATMPGGSQDPIGGRGWPGAAPWQFPITASGNVVSFDQTVGTGVNDNTSFHLGGAQVGGSGWKWKAAPAYTNNIPLDGLGSYPIGGITYGGNKVMTAGNHVVYGFHGEFWNQSQADQYMHFNEDGLFVGQFGVPGDLWRPGTAKIGGKGGNGFTPTLVQYNGETYLWHGNESPIGGIQRWHLVGANNIREMSGSGTLGGSASLSDSGVPFPGGLTATPGSAKVDLIWQAVPGAVSYNVKRATRSGGPYTTVATGVTNATRSVTGLTNGTAYYFVVSAVDGSSVESANSSQVKATPFDTTVPVQLAGEAAFIGSLNTFAVDSTGPAKGMAATFLDSSYDRLGNLSNSSIGSKGYVLYDWSGDNTVVSNLIGGTTITPDGTWSNSDNIAMQFVLDGAAQWRGTYGPHSLQTSPTSSSSININVTDTNWHFLTLFSPANWNGQRHQITTLTPQGSSTPSVSYTADDLYYDATINGYSYINGYNRIYQFRFKGNVTLKIERLANDTSGTVAAIFLDDMPASTAPPLPVAPTSLTATAGNAQVTLNWNTVAGATSYKVFRGTTSNGQSATPIASGVTTNSYVDTSVTNGTTYYYKVAAVNATGTGPNSNQASATPQVPAPSAPLGLTALAGDAQATLNWSASAGATSYNVYRGTSAGGESATPIITGVTSTSYVNTGLTNGTTYYYKVKAVNAGGTSGYSNEASATPSSPYASIIYASVSPTIDGTVDSSWSAAPSYNISKLVNGTTSVTGSWKAMWNSSNLYILATVSDSSLLNSTADYFGDSVELYVDADNSKSTSYGANDFQYILGWGDTAVNEYAHSATSGVSYAQTNITGGYRMEFAIPWSTLGVTPAANNLVGIDAGIDDAASSSARAGQKMWWGTDNNYINPSLFGTGKLLP